MSIVEKTIIRDVEAVNRFRVDLFFEKEYDDVWVGLETDYTTEYSCGFTIEWLTDIVKQIKEGKYPILSFCKDKDMAETQINVTITRDITRITIMYLADLSPEFIIDTKKIL